jgi:transcriptional regulator with XRE-family HTH domain
MRLLRLEYDIALPELARTVGVSPQYFSGLELGEFTATRNAVRLVQIAFDRVLAERRDKAGAMLAAYANCREQILDFVEGCNGD